MYWLIRDIWSPANLVASCVTKLDNALPRFMDVQWDSFWATHRVSTDAFAWNITLGQGRTGPSSLITL
jgi:hypothetical protein